MCVCVCVCVCPRACPKFGDPTLPMKALEKEYRADRAQLLTSKTKYEASVNIDSHRPDYDIMDTMHAPHRAAADHVLCPMRTLDMCRNGLRFNCKKVGQRVGGLQ